MSIAIEYLYHQKKVIADRYIPLDPRTYYKLNVLSEDEFMKNLKLYLDVVKCNPDLIRGRVMSPAEYYLQLLRPVTEDHQ